MTFGEGAEDRAIRVLEDRHGRPGFFQVRRPNELWHLDMTSVWVAEHGWCYLITAIDCCTREIVAWHLELRCRAKESIALVEQAAAARTIRPGTLTLGTDNGSAFTTRAFKLVHSGLGITHRRGGLLSSKKHSLARQTEGRRLRRLSHMDNQQTN